MVPRRTRVGFGQALRYALAGLHHAVRTQRTFRIQLICAAGVAVLVGWLRLSTVEAAVLALALFGVLAAELFNTGVEITVDILVQHNHHQLARLAKDIAAAAVVTSVVGAVLAGGLILGPPLLHKTGVSAAWTIRVSWVGAVLVLLAAAAGLVRLARRSAPDEPSGGPRPGAS